MILETRQALYIQRLRYGAEKITPKACWVGRPRVRRKLLGRTDIGELAVGKQADLALFKLDELRFSGSHDPISALLLCGADRADRVMVGGKWRVIDGQVEGLDLKGLIADHSQAAPVDQRPLMRLLRRLPRWPAAALRSQQRQHDKGREQHKVSHPFNGVGFAIVEVDRADNQGDEHHDCCTGVMAI